MAKLPPLPDGVRRLTWTMSSARSKGKGRSSTVFTIVKTVALAPIPKPRTTTAVSAKIGVRRNDRIAKRRSRRSGTIATWIGIGRCVPVCNPLLEVPRQVRLAPSVAVLEEDERIGEDLVEILERELVANSAEVGAYLKRGLEWLMDKYDCIGDVRGLGMMLGVEFVKNRATKERDAELRDRVEMASFERGLILLGAGQNTIRWSPPLILSRENVDVALEIFDEAIAAARELILIVIRPPAAAILEHFS
jgi:hypothetical protein